MGSDQAFLQISEQQEKLLDYWCNHQQPCGRVPRTAINPGRVRELLSNISIVELRKSGTSTFRLAGSKLRDIVGVEARGRSVSTVQGGELEPWCDAILSVLDTCLPVAGQTEREDGYIHLWLRLPLLDRDGELTQVMCHDELLKPDHDGVFKYRRISDLIPSERERRAA